MDIFAERITSQTFIYQKWSEILMTNKMVVWSNPDIRLEYVMDAKKVYAVVKSSCKNGN